MVFTYNINLFDYKNNQCLMKGLKYVYSSYYVIDLYFIHFCPIL